MRRDVVLPAALAGWTTFVWATRIRNIARDGGGALSLAVAVALVALALLVVASLVRRGEPRWAVSVLAAATVVVWAVRVPTILLGDHRLAFDLVHSALGAVSVGLAILAVRATGADRRPARAPASSA